MNKGQGHVLEALVDEQAKRIERLNHMIAIQDLVIDYLYDSLGPAADDIMDMAYEYAEKKVEDE